MSPQHRGFLRVDDQGRLVLPPETVARLHLLPGRRVPFIQNEAELSFGHPIDHLERVYIEPTNQCNFDCRTCMRNAWDELPGSMTAETFERVLDGLKSFSPQPLVFFGGFGEPLSHPAIFEMVSAVKQTGAKVELITNGSLLTNDAAARLVSAGLDRLWVSIDGATPESYADVRLGDALPEVIHNLENLDQVRSRAGMDKPSLGIAFVAMKRNIHELPEVIRLGRRLGADRFSISNVLAHTPELRGEVLYGRSFYDTDQPVSKRTPLIQLPRFEINEQTGVPLAAALEGRVNIQIAGQPFQQGSSTCPFLEKRSVSVRWDGEVSPCLPLLHSHVSYLAETQRRSKAFSFGSLHQHSLLELWDSPDYRAFRERLAAFDFSPCVFCNSCENAESNQEDCFGSTAPACGGCLWAQGFIRCP